jgi:flagellar basal-body rod protein FlgC
MVDSNNTGTSPILAVAASGMRAQQARMRIIAENLANSDSTAKTPDGDPYRRQAPVFMPTKVEGGAQGVKMVRVAADPTAFKMEYQPGHPAANKTGYVKLPNVDALVEAMDMREAQRAYEANLNVIENVRSMESSLIAILKK